MTHRHTSVAIALIGILGFMGDLPYAAADSPIGPPRPKSTPNTQVTSPTLNNAPPPANATPSPTPDAAVNQGKPELRFVAVAIEGIKLWLGGGDIDVREFRTSKVVTFRLLNKLDSDHGFAIDALKIKQIIKPGDEVSFSVSLEEFDQSVSVYRYYCQLHPSHWGGTGVITGRETPPRPVSAPVVVPKNEPVRGKDSSTARAADEKAETETLKGKLLKIEKGFYVIESAPHKEVRVSAPLDAAVDENGKSLMGEWIEAQISSDLHVTGIKKSPAGYAVEGEILKIDGDVYSVMDGPGKNVQLRLTKDTKVEGTLKIGDEIKAEFTPDGNITFISKKAGPPQEVQTVPAPEKPVRPVQEVLKLDRDWASALVRRDTRSLERAMADNGIATAWNSEVLNKPQYLAEIASGDFAFKSIEIDEAKVRVYGDAVLVTGRYTVKGRYKEQDISGQHRYTNLYVKQQGAWRLVSQNVHPQPQ